MSDGDEFLVDDLGIGDTTLDDKYNLGNEEEELLLAGGNIIDTVEPIIKPEIKTIQEDKPILECTQEEKSQLVNTNEEKTQLVNTIEDKPQLVNVQEDKPKLVNVQEDIPKLVITDENKPKSVDTHEEAPKEPDSSANNNDVINNDEPKTVIDQDKISKEPEIVQPGVENEKPESDSTENKADATAKAQIDQRYRDGHKERFPTERSDDAPGSNQPNIPDSLDTIQAEGGPGQFNQRKNFIKRGHNKANYQHIIRRPDNYVKKNPELVKIFESQSSLYNIDSFRPICSDARFSGDFRSVSYDGPKFNRFGLPNNFQVRQNPAENFCNDINLEGLRSLDNNKLDARHNPRAGNARASGNSGCSNEPNPSSNFPNPAFPPERLMKRPDCDAAKPRDNFGPRQPENKRDFFNNRAPMQHNDNRPEPFPLQTGNNKSQDSGYVDRPPFDHRLNNFNPTNKMRNDNPPLLNYPGNMTNLPPPMFPPRGNALGPPGVMRNHPPMYEQSITNAPPPRINDNFKNLPPMHQESKKVLINPHFKGPTIPHDIVLQQSQLHNMNRNIQNEAFNMHDGASFLRNKLPGNSSKPDLGNAQVSERELERMAQQFIEEQQRCLKRAAANAQDDYYEKTQRFIDSTSIDVRNLQNTDSDARKEHLKRKQEEFINENRLNLRRRRNGSPMRSSHRSPPGNRYRTSPYRRNRSRSSQSPPQSKREPSGEPEDRDYRAKLREQAELRAKLLQAKERRRRRDAANLTEKLNHKSSPVPVEDKVETLSTLAKKPDDDNASNSAEISDDLLKVENNTPAFNQQAHQDDKTPVPKSGNDKETENEPHETLDDMLEDDLLRLSPEEEDLLLSDDDDLTMNVKTNLADKQKISSTKTTQSSSTNVKDKADKSANKTSTQISKSKQNNLSAKRSHIDNTEDLRKKLTKTWEAASVPPVSTTTQPPRKKIVFSNEENVTVKSKSPENKDKAGKETDRLGANKWRSTFSEQKLDLTAPVAARAISAVMRNTSETSNRKVVAPKNSKPLQLAASKENDKSTGSSSNGNSAADDKVWSGRQVVNRRVVLPPRQQKPLVIVENEDDEPELYVDAAKSEKSKIDKKTTARVSGLPPGMTEARLLSLCGPDVERVSVDGAGNADVNFSSIAACQRFVRRFNGRLVAACRLSVTVAT